MNLSDSTILAAHAQAMRASGMPDYSQLLARNDALLAALRALAGDCTGMGGAAKVPKRSTLAAAIAVIANNEENQQ